MFIQGFSFNKQELRIEDYEAGRKTGAADSTGLSTNTSTELFEDIPVMFQDLTLK